MEDDAARPESGEVDPAEKLRKLEEEIARLREQIAPPYGQAEMSDKSDPSDMSDESDETDPPQEAPKPLTPEQQAEIEAILKQAQLARIRKQASVATKLLREAAEQAPGSALVLEALGDDQMERKVCNAAATSYAKALKLDPGNVALEKKHADAIYYTHAAGISLDLGDDNSASPKARIFLAVLLPGVGQMVRGAWGKGFIILGGFVVSLIVTIVIRGMTERAPTTDNRFTFTIPLAVGLAFWLWGIVDASAGAKSAPRSIKLDRPKPPVDLPFE